MVRDSSKITADGTYVLSRNYLQLVVIMLVEKNFSLKLKVKAVSNVVEK
jgi:hypothetical protein